MNLMCMPVPNKSSAAAAPGIIPEVWSADVRRPHALLLTLLVKHRASVQIFVNLFT